MVRRVMICSWKAMYSSRMPRRVRILGWRWLFTRASMTTAKVVCIWVWANRRFKTTWALASFFSSMTMRMPFLPSDSSRNPEMPSSRLSFT